jgi:fructose-1,6-bisphosphatase I
VDFKKCKEGKMTEIFDAIKKSAIRIREAIEFDDTGYSNDSNATGDKSDIIVEEEFRKIPSIKEIISEEKEYKTPLHVEGHYLVGYDPLDGSSLIDVNLSVGSIFGIYEDDYSGPNLIASVYVVYGPRVELVIATDKVRMYRLNKKNDFVYITLFWGNGSRSSPNPFKRWWTFFISFN